MANVGVFPQVYSENAIPQPHPNTLFNPAAGYFAKDFSQDGGKVCMKGGKSKRLRRREKRSKKNRKHRNTKRK